MKKLIASALDGPLWFPVWGVAVLGYAAATYGLRVYEYFRWDRVRSGRNIVRQIPYHKPLGKR